MFAPQKDLKTVFKSPFGVTTVPSNLVVVVTVVLAVALPQEDFPGQAPGLHLRRTIEVAKFQDLMGLWTSRLAIVIPFSFYKWFIGQVLCLFDLAYELVVSNSNTLSTVLAYGTSCGARDGAVRYSIVSFQPLSRSRAPHAFSAHSMRPDNPSQHPEKAAICAEHVLSM